MRKICIKVRNIDMNEDIATFVSSDEKLPFYVSMCGISYCDGSYIINRPNSGTNVIEYIVSGTGTVTEDNNTFYPGEGDVYFLKHGRNHCYYSDSENPWTKIWINFEGSLADEITKSYGLLNKAHFYAPEFKEYFNEMYKISRSGGGVKEISDRIAVIFLQVAQKLSNISNTKEGKYSSLAESIKKQIDNLTDYKITLDKIVKNMSYSKCHIIREFKAAYGETPYEYILKKKFNTAKIMLENTVVSISDIADELGFCDVHYFSSCFSKRFGLSPSMYRKRNVANAFTSEQLSRACLFAKKEE